MMVSHPLKLGNLPESGGVGVSALRAGTNLSRGVTENLILIRRAGDTSTILTPQWISLYFTAAKEKP